MNHDIGSAIDIVGEVPTDRVSGTTLTATLYDPDGDAVFSDQSMTFETVNQNVAYKRWQSVSGTHAAGRYKFVIKATNGGFTTSEKGYFFLESI